MSNIENGKIIARIAAIVGIIFAFVEIGAEAISIVSDLIWYGTIYDFWMFVYIAMAIIAIIFGFLILTRFIPMVDEDTQTAGIYILIFGLIGSIGVWSYVGWAVGTLYVIAAILILIESSGGGA
jgi:hypothetical protein